MKPNSKFKLNNMPKMLISHRDLEAIRHVVDIAPKEAQWFCRCKKTKYKNTTIYLIYEMYIPEQYCSAAEVESDPMMMVNFYKELKKEHGQEETNNIMSNMTVWCHSHHNMGVGPSGQDIKQFNENIENAIASKQDAPQVMLIFNKKDQYHCKLWDPETNLILENLDLEVLRYDFSNLDQQAKTKFKKKKVIAKKGKSSKKTIYSSQEDGWDFLEWGIDTEQISRSKSRGFLTESYIHYGISDHPSLENVIKKYNQDKRAFLENLIKELDINELNLFKVVLDLDIDSIWELEEGTVLEEPEQIFEDLLQDLEAYDHDEDLITLMLVFCKSLNSKPQKATNLLTEFEQVLEEWEMEI